MSSTPSNARGRLGLCPDELNSFNFEPIILLERHHLERSGNNIGLGSRDPKSRYYLQGGVGGITVT